MSLNWLVEYVLQSIGTLYAIAVGLALLFALLLPRNWCHKATAVAVVLGLASIPLFQGYAQYERGRVAAEAFKQRLRVAEKMFEKRCTGAGEKIHRTVSGVSGVYLVNLRQRVPNRDQFDMNDPAGDGATGIGYIQTFLMGRDAKEPPFMLYEHTRAGAYQFVESMTDDGIGLLRYIDERTTMGGTLGRGQWPTATKVEARHARFGIELQDISTREDRTYWIAGNRIRVVDLHTHEVVAERVGYIMDRGQGNTSGERSPWLFARYHACPEFPKLHDVYPRSYGLTRSFVEKVLKPQLTPSECHESTLAG